VQLSEGYALEPLKERIAVQADWQIKTNLMKTNVCGESHRGKLSKKIKKREKKKKSYDPKWQHMCLQFTFKWKKLEVFDSCIS